jgi:hypothetical protein
LSGHHRQQHTVGHLATQRVHGSQARCFQLSQSGSADRQSEPGRVQYDSGWRHYVLGPSDVLARHAEDSGLGVVGM